MTVLEPAGVHQAWLPPEAFRAIGARRALVLGDGPLAGTVRDELAQACARYGGSVRPGGDLASADGGPYDLVLAAGAGESLPAVAAAVRAEVRSLGAEIGGEGFVLARRDGVTVVLADEPAGLLYGLFHLVRLGEAAFEDTIAVEHHRPALRLRMLDHWDNVDVHPVMGQVERGYAGGSIFWRDGALRDDLRRVRAYARLLAACGINAVAVNNVNVHTTEARLLTDRLGDVAAIAGELRPYGIRVHLSVDFAAPVTLGGASTADPLDEDVRTWWAETTERVYDTIPDFGGYVVKADSEGRPGPFAYGRSHADGANMLAEALAPFGGVVHWRAFVYDHRQDWRDRSTDRARAAHDHFAPLDGLFGDNVILQVKHGPIDFQPREPVSPVIAAMPATRVAVELQVTQEYTGQQRHVCYLAPMWSEVLGFRLSGPAGPSVAQIAGGAAAHHGRAAHGAAAANGAVSNGAVSNGAVSNGVAELDGTAQTYGGGGLVGVSNVGDDDFWTGHPLAQANLYAFGRLAWAPDADPAAILDEWIGLTFPAFPPDMTGGPDRPRSVLHAIMDDSWRTYERYTAPLGVGFMVRPGHHYGPDVDGYEYTPWGTYHFADRDGVGVDRTRATGTGYTGQYPEPWSQVYESIERCPDEVLLFFHHVPYGHVLHSGSTVIQHIYDTHFAGVEEVVRAQALWAGLAGAGSVPPALHARVADLLDEQLRCAREWRDQVNTYFFRKSGVPDAHGRRIW
ncbi:xylan alpha-(1-_2)-glucuronosidase [Sphaerisporangium melleum]|uniref:Xylan alpha-(1->2)-glucuronosidase n=1 Tax=Sphaerisporangium melleum TaxID=321316 RepID=A0A917RNX6_9ACTN|nr:alpha-glucuronidase [Sphaerisporangium melleum]GGL15720.1 xylan alpha-(1->2)-glucuronosidase [Sphaerisporangium melleum]GII69650.1 xylan alpha-(1->2)-glucuronosidase [Sphaerisporangium melleum]